MDRQQSADEAMECRGLDHPGQNKKERPKQNDNKTRKESRRPGLEHPGRNKQQGLPPPGLDRPGKSGGQTPRTGSSGVDQAAGAAATRTGSSGDKGRLDAADLIIWVGSGSKSHRTQDSTVEGHVAGGRSDWIIRRGTGRSSHNRRGRGKMACCSGQDGPGQINQKRSTQPGLQRPGESGGQGRRKQEAETKVVQRRSQDRKQHKEQRRGNAESQRGGRGRGDAEQQR